MSSPASLKNHPFHPMLVVLPLGMWTFAVVALVVRAVGGTPYAAWGNAALYTSGVGVIGAVLAAVPGLIDLLSLPASRAKTIGVWHMVLNLAAVALFAICCGLLWVGYGVSGPLTLGILGFATVLVSGWLGGEMVYVNGVAVKRDADLNARPERITRPERGEGPIGREAA